MELTMQFKHSIKSSRSSQQYVSSTQKKTSAAKLCLNVMQGFMANYGNPNLKQRFSPPELVVETSWLCRILNEYFSISRSFAQIRGKNVLPFPASSQKPAASSSFLG